jgi:hypothetical protein
LKASRGGLELFKRKVGAFKREVGAFKREVEKNMK